MSMSPFDNEQFADDWLQTVITEAWEKMRSEEPDSYAAAWAENEKHGLIDGAFALGAALGLEKAHLMFHGGSDE